MRAEDALVGDERVPAAAAEDGTLPKAFDLLVRGGIGGGDVEFHCAIPGGYTGGVEITIFDVGEGEFIRWRSPWRHRGVTSSLG